MNPSAGMKLPTARLSVVTAALLVYALICAIPTHLWLFEIATPFRVQMAIAALSLAVINAYFHRKVSTALCVLCAAFLTSHLPAYFSPDPVYAGQSPTLRLLHWNTWRDVHSTDDMHWALKEFNPDLAFFQEVTEAEAAEFESDLYRKQYLGDFLVLSKLDVEFTMPAEVSKWTDEPSVDLKVRFAERELAIHSMHPPAPFSPRRLRHRNEYFFQLSHVVAGHPEPSVLIGDLNTVPTDPAFKRLLESTNTINSMNGFGLQTTWPFDLWWNPLLQIAIDHCLVAPELRVVDRRVADSKSSNHKPLVVDLQWMDA